MNLAEFQDELSGRIDYVLDKMPICDHQGYDALAYVKMPGPHYYQVLRGMHRFLRPKRYVEIGVRDGTSLSLAFPETACIGIDPAPRCTSKPNVSICKMSSDAFFAQRTVEAGLSFDLAFIDGDHTFEQALRDFENLERHAHAGSVITLHDVIPLNERTSTPECGTAFWTGNVWRLMAAIVAGRKDLNAFTIPCPPTGLGVVLGFHAGNRGVRTADAIAALDLPFDPTWSVLSERLNIVSDPAAFAVVLGREDGRPPRSRTEAIDLVNSL